MVLGYMNHHRKDGQDFLAAYCLGCGTTQAVMATAIRSFLELELLLGPELRKALHDDVEEKALENHHAV